MVRSSIAVAIVALTQASPAYALGEDPVMLMATLESQLLGARRVVIESDIEATGAIAVKLTGRTEVDERNRARVSYAGEFAGKPVALMLESDGSGLKLANGSATQALPVEAESNRALLIGLVRMGVLHNLARLTSLKGPDHAEAGVTDWVQLDSFRPTTYAVGGDLEGLMSFGYDLVVEEKTTGSVRLWMDPVSGIPKRRAVVVHFPGGDMNVTEDYRTFELLR